jgi:hypothetical protein
MNNSYIALRWTTFGLAIILPFLAWASYYNWQINTLTIYQIYPLLGIMAFCIMATHFIFSALGTKLDIQSDITYTKVNALVVLALILMHPGLFYYQLLKDGYGLPPNSSIEFVGQSMAIFIFLGTFGLLLFLSYDFARYLIKKSFVANNWFWIIIIQYIAMLAIIIHAWGLGGITQNGWFQYLWVALGLLVIFSAYFNIPHEWKKQKTIKNQP